MTNWKKTFHINDIFFKRNGEAGPEDWTDKTVHELGKEMARRIQRAWPQHMIDGEECDFTLVEVYDWFYGIQSMKQYDFMLNQMLAEPEITDEEYLEWQDRTPLKDFNECMGVFYDWCDRNLVWINK